MYVYIYTSDNKSVYIQFIEFLYLCIHTYIRIIRLILVLNELSNF